MDDTDVSIEGVWITGIDKAVLLAALYNHARPQGLGFLQYNPAPMTLAEAQTIIDAGRAVDTGPAHLYFDYLRGRSMKVDLGGDSLRTDLYDRDNGQGAAARIVATLRGSP